MTGDNVLSEAAQRFSPYAEQDASGKPLPVDQWHPPFCGDIDMRIARDGTWFHNGTPILRPAMVQLFSRILRKEGDAYFLVTPVEKVGIQVEDVPFVAVEMTAEGGVLTFRTNVGDVVTADAEHPLHFDSGEDGFKPYVCVRNGLFARLSRALAQDIAALAVVAQQAEGEWLGVWSAGTFFPIAQADAIGGAPTAS